MGNPLRRPMVAICLAYVLGLLAVAAADWPSRAAVIVGLLVLAATASLRSGSGVLLIAAIAGLGAARYAAFVHPGPNDIHNFASGDRVRITGAVVDDSAIVGHRLTTVVLVTRIESDGKQWPASGRLWTRFYLPDDSPAGTRLPDYGDVVSFNCFLRRPEEFSAAGSFSWPRYLAMKGIFTTAYSAWDKAEVRYSRGAGGGTGGRAAHAVRHELVNLINARYPKAEAATVAGILLGISTDLPLGDRIAFTRTGTYHLLAASGFNCLIIIIVFGRYLFPWLRVHKRLSHVLLIGFLIFYAMVSGGRPSIVRAATMASLYLFAFLIDRVEDPLNILAAAAVVILVARPGDIFDAGFRLSFAAVASLITIAPLLRSWEAMGKQKPDGWRQWLRYPVRETKEAVTATTAVTLGTTPLTAAYFNYLSLVSIPANALVAFLALLVFVATCISLALGWMPVIGGWLNGIGVFFVRALLLIVRTLGSWEFASVSVRSPGHVALAGYYLLLIVGVWYASERSPSSKL